MNSPSFKYKNGFTLIEVLVGLGLLAVFILISMTCMKVIYESRATTKTMTSRDRILAGIRTFARMPAAIRNSVRAADANGVAINPDLITCINGTPANSCQGGKSYPFALYSPLMTVGAAGALTIQAIASPLGNTNPLRFDEWGEPCDTTRTNCPLLVFTSFKAQCGPNPLPNPTPNPVPQSMLAPNTTCTVADVIEVTYLVRLDPTMSGKYPGLGIFLIPYSGTAVTSVHAISGNYPQ